MTARRRRRQAGCLGLVMTCAVLLIGACGGSPGASEPATSASPTRQLATPNDYVSRGSRYPQWGFVTPSSEWMCVIGAYPSGGDNAACAVSPNQGPLPIADVPFAQAPTGEISSQIPNVISIPESSDPAFRVVAEPIWSGADPPRELPYDTVLQVGGFSCNVQRAGVSCRSDSTGMGFTFSTKGYELTYTDVPAG